MQSKKLLAAAVLALLVVTVSSVWLLNRPQSPIAPSNAEKANATHDLKKWESVNQLPSNATASEKYEYYAARTSYVSGTGDYKAATEEFKKAEATGQEIRFGLYAEAGVAYELLGDKQTAAEFYNKSIAAANKQLTGDSKTQIVIGLKANLERLK